MLKKCIPLTLVFATLLLTGCTPAVSSSLSPSSSSSSMHSSSELSSENGDDYNGVEQSLSLSFTFDELNGCYAYNGANGNEYKVDYVFNESNAANLFKEPNDPLLKKGVSGKSLYMDGFSNRIKLDDYEDPVSKITFSAFVAPRVFENVFDYDHNGVARGHTRLTSIFNKGNIELCEGFLFGYGRLGRWGMQLCLHSYETGEDFMVGFYDPLHTLELYQWSHIAASFDGDTGYICLTYNGEVCYEGIIPELANTYIIQSYEPLYVGYYCQPMIEFGIDRQMPAGLLDEINMYNESLDPKQLKELYSIGLDEEGNHPNLPFSEVQLDSSVYEGDRYRPQYHALPPAVWMNEPHSPFYYKGKYHVFYQHNPSGPYWSQIRWGHLVSDDMVHWEYVKDAVVPTKDICPEGVWTGGACIGPDGLPWLAITSGTNTTTWSIQNVAFCHPADPNDPYLVDWIIEDINVITQPNDDSMGELNQFRDPFVWYDAPYYYMMVSTSIPGRGGSANMYRSTNMREWEYKGYFFECDYGRYPEQGAHWECVVMLPISTKDGSITKYIVFDCPQYTVDGYIVDCYYWIGRFDKNTCRFIPDDEKPRLFDLGRGVYTGQNGFTYLTEEDIANGKTNYEQGRTVIYAIAQGKAAGTAQNKIAGWAHNFAIPLELHLDDEGRDVLREPIKEIESLYQQTLYSYEGEGKNANEINEEIKDIRGDLLRIKGKIALNPTQNEFNSGIYVRYNKNVIGTETERTAIKFTNNGVYIDRLKSTLHDYVDRQDSYMWNNVKNEYEFDILLDRSMLEVYVDEAISFTTRIYPKYGNSDYLCLFDEGGGLNIKSLEIYEMGSAYRDTVTPAYYGNVGNFGE